MQRTVDLNCDMGESFGVYGIGRDDEMLELISSANIACGFHAGDPRVMERTVTRAAERGVAIGAHVGFPDLVGFGRRQLLASPDEVRTDVLYQVGAVFAFCRSLGVPLQHVKPHGALYNMALKDRSLADAVAQAVAAFDRDLILVALKGSELAQTGQRAGLRVAWEGFADRAYNPDGTLVDRSRPDAVITDADAAARRVARMVTEGVVEAVDGSVIDHPVHTVCIHGDNPEAVALARAVRRRLEATGVRVEPMGRVLG